MTNKTPIIIYASPLALALIGMLCNAVGFGYNKYSPLNFIFSVAYCIAWIIIFTFAPKYRKKSIQIYLMVWWFISMIFSVAYVFSYFITGGRPFDWRIVPDLMLVAPIAGVQYIVNTLDFGKYITAGICFIFLTVSLSQFLIAQNMWTEQDREKQELSLALNHKKD